MKKIKLSDLIDLLKNESESSIKYRNHLYFGIDDIAKLPKILKNFEFTEGIILYVYCIFDDDAIMEAYWDTLAINITNDAQDNIDHFILHETGKSSLTEVDSIVENRFRKTYFEIKPGDDDGFANAIKTYTQFMKTEEIDIINEGISVHPNVKIKGIFYQIA